MRERGVTTASCERAAPLVGTRHGRVCSALAVPATSDSGGVTADATGVAVAAGSAMAATVTSGVRWAAMRATRPPPPAVSRPPAAGRGAAARGCASVTGHRGGRARRPPPMPAAVACRPRRPSAIPSARGRCGPAASRLASAWALDGGRVGGAPHRGVPPHPTGVGGHGWRGALASAAGASAMTPDGDDAAACVWRAGAGGRSVGRQTASGGGGDGGRRSTRIGQRSGTGGHRRRQLLWVLATVAMTGVGAKGGRKCTVVATAGVPHWRSRKHAMACALPAGQTPRRGRRPQNGAQGAGGNPAGAGLARP